MHIRDSVLQKILASKDAVDIMLKLKIALDPIIFKALAKKFSISENDVIDAYSAYLDSENIRSVEQTMRLLGSKEKKGEEAQNINEKTFDLGPVMPANDENGELIDWLDEFQQLGDQISDARSPKEINDGIDEMVNFTYEIDGSEKREIIFDIKMAVTEALRKFFKDEGIEDSENNETGSFFVNESNETVLPFNPGEGGRK